MDTTSCDSRTTTTVPIHQDTNSSDPPMPTTVRVQLDVNTPQANHAYGSAGLLAALVRCSGWPGARALCEDHGVSKPEPELVVARNRRARHDYFLEGLWEAGIVLQGTEVKSLRAGRASLVDGFVDIDGGEAWMYGVHIPAYAQGTWTNHASRRKRKLLLHRTEIDRLERRLTERGLTIVPLRLYFHDGRAKVEIALARGKREWDKRQALRERQDNLEATRAIREKRDL